MGINNPAALEYTAGNIYRVQTTAIIHHMWIEDHHLRPTQNGKMADKLAKPPYNRHGKSGDRCYRMNNSFH